MQSLASSFKRIEGSRVSLNDLNGFMGGYALFDESMYYRFGQ